MSTDALRAHLRAGQVIPAHPLALTASRTLDERHQRALTRYYVEAGAGGIAVGVHTTQFAIREHGLYAPVLALAAETMHDWRGRVDPARPVALVAGVSGPTPQAVREAETARSLGYDAVLVSPGALRDATEEAIVAHHRAIGEVLPLVGFYLQPAVGGRVLSYRYWCALAELPELTAVKLAPFDRYRTLDVVRALATSGRDDVALYTGNDDAIVADLVTPFRVPTERGVIERRIVGGLLGQWAVGTRAAVGLHAEARAARSMVPASLLARGAALTDLNGALFDARHDFAGCIAGIHELLRGQGLLAGCWCLDPHEGLSPGQAEEIARVSAAYPDLTDADFVRARRDDWLR